ncbi:MAG: aspartate carbamoyltransferase catalytic subunit [Pseudomonadota bacterium]
MKHLTDITALTSDEIRPLLDEALRYDRAISEGDDLRAPLKGLLQFNLFYENSTRTSLSFEVAGKRLGADVVAVPVSASSVHKGESLRDTVLTIAAQGASILVLRASGAGTIDATRTVLRENGYATGIINAGEGAFGHPTQALLDAATLLKAFRRTPEQGLKGISIAIIGDLLHSRVAASCTPLFASLGAEVRLCGPRDLLPHRAPAGAAFVTADRNEALHEADVVMALRIQRERFDENLTIDVASYRQDYGITMEALSFAKPGAFVMHPGPMNRDVEIDGDVADDRSRSLILDQVAMGVPTRMAVLRYAAGR